MLCVGATAPLTRSTSSQCRAHRSPQTKIPTSVSRASLDSPRPSSAEPRGSPLLQRLGAKVRGRRRCSYSCSCRGENRKFSLFLAAVYLPSVYRGQRFPLMFLIPKQEGGSWSPEKRSSVPRHTSILSRRGHHDHEESSTSITSSGSTAPRRPTCELRRL